MKLCEHVTLLHSERPKLYAVLAVLRAIGLEKQHFSVFVLSSVQQSYVRLDFRLCFFFFFFFFHAYIHHYSFAVNFTHNNVNNFPTLIGFGG